MKSNIMQNYQKFFMSKVLLTLTLYERKLKLIYYWSDGDLIDLVDKVKKKHKSLQCIRPIQECTKCCRGSNETVLK